MVRTQGLIKAPFVPSGQEYRQIQRDAVQLVRGISLRNALRESPAPAIAERRAGVSFQVVHYHLGQPGADDDMHVLAADVRDPQPGLICVALGCGLA
jgi:hypothetical protein